MIRAQIKNFGYSTFIYGIANLLTKIISIVLIPLYTKYLSVNDVGIIALFEMFEVFLITIIPLGTITSMWRYLSESDINDKQSIIKSTFIIIFLSGIVIIVIFYYVIQHLIGNISLAINGNLIYYLLISCFFRVTSNFLFWILQYKNSVIKYLFFSLIQFLSVIGLTIYFIIIKDYGIISVYLAKIIVLSVFFIITIIYVFKESYGTPSLFIGKKLIRYGLPIVPLALLAPILNTVDRFFINTFCSLEDLGKYGIAYKFGMLMNMFLVVPIQRSWGPQMFKVGDFNKDTRIIHQDLTFYYAYCGIFILVVLSFFSDSFLYFFATESYYSASWIIPWVALAYFIGGFRIFLQAGASLRDRTDLFFSTAIITMLFSVVLNWLLIENYGIFGAVIATIVSYLFLVTLLYINGKKITNIDWPISKIIYCAIIAIFLIIIVNYIIKFSPNYSIYYKCVGIILYPIISILTNLIGDKEIKGIKSICNLLVNKV